MLGVMAEKLEALLKKQIQTTGPMNVGAFMAQALGHPEHGYYMGRDPFGVAGDFTTAPEISQMFGEMIGAWIADIWAQMGAPKKFILLECGPGRGTLMADALRATKNVRGFHAALKLHFLETSPAMKAAQEKAVQSYNPAWHEGLDTVPDDLPLIVIGNEFLDALPVRQLQKTKNGWAERMVGLNDSGDFCFSLVPYIGAAPDAPGAAAEGHIFEFSPAQVSFVTEICRRIKRQGGAALFIDYGENESKYGESLQAIADHKVVSIFDHVGEADISANVDFGAMAQAASKEGAAVFGPVAQGDFLNNLGIEQRAEVLMKAAKTQAQKEDIEKALHRLCDSGEMGAMFKAIGFAHGKALNPAGF